jgi:hypothetical protein
MRQPKGAARMGRTVTGKYPDWLRYGNLGLAFLLELAALIAFALVGMLVPTGWLQLAAGIAAVAVFVVIWGIWAAPRSKRRLRGTSLLVFKVAVFAVAVTILVLVGQVIWAALLAVLVVVHLGLARMLHQH